MPDLSDPKEGAVKTFKSLGGWATGDLLAHKEGDGTYFALLCVKARTYGPRGRIIPAEMAQIAGETPIEIRRAIRSLGLVVPHSLPANRV